MKRRYAILGTGALGGYYGARLHHAGHDVWFVLHRDYSYVQEHGLTVLSPHGDFSIPQPQCVHRLEDLPPIDVLCLATKTIANPSLIPQLRQTLSPEGGVLVFQNGLGVEDEIAKAISPHPVWGGLCFLCSHKRGPGTIEHLDYDSIRLGFHPSASLQAQEALQKIASDFESSGIPVSLEPSLDLARWKKLVWNIPFNGLSVILKQDTRQILSNPHGVSLVKKMMEEVLQAAQACGVSIPHSFIDKMILDTQKMNPYLPSMRLDYDQGKPLEIETIYHRPLQQAQEHGFQMNRVQTLYEQLLCLQPPL